MFSLDVIERIAKRAGEISKGETGPTIIQIICLIKCSIQAAKTCSD
jgi:hypothetical protein